MDGAIQGLVVLGSIRKLAEQVSKQHASMAYVSAPVSRFPLCLNSCPDFCGDEEQYGSVTE